MRSLHTLWHLRPYYRKAGGKRRGLTLVELLIVIAVIALLAAISIPIFTTSLRNAARTVEDANFREVKLMALEQILTDHMETASGGWLAYADIDKDGNVVSFTLFRADGSTEDYFKENPRQIFPDGEFMCYMLYLPAEMFEG